MDFQQLKEKLEEQVDNNGKELIKKRIRLKYEYSCRYCERCIKQGKQKDRNCSILIGARLPGCKNMSKYVDKRIKKERKKCMKDSIKLCALEIFQLNRERFEGD